MSNDKFYEVTDEIDIKTTEDIKKMKLLEAENQHLKTVINTKNKKIKDYEEAITNSSIKDLSFGSNAAYTNEDILNIMINQAFIVVK